MNPTTDTLTPKHRADLDGSGLSAETIRAAGLYSEHDPAKTARYLNWTGGTAKFGACLVFPYLDAQGKPFTFTDAGGKPVPFCTLKPDSPRTTDTDKARKYELPKGVSPRLYVPPGAWAAVNDPAAELFITEGQKKALRATQDGFPCASLSGVNAWQKARPKKDGHGVGPRELIDDLAAIHWRGRVVWIVFDADLASNPAVATAQQQLVKALTAKGATVRVVRLPAGGPKGLDDFLAARGADAFRALVAAVAIEQAKQQQVTFTFDDTDVANGRRFAADNGADVRYVADWQQWVVYDGRRWEVDHALVRIEQLAKATAQRMADEAARRGGSILLEIARASGAELERLKEEKRRTDGQLSHAKKSADMRSIGRMLHAARSEPTICVAKGGKLFDTHRDLLNCPNGTVELRTGKLREHRREDFLTRLCPTRFDATARRRSYFDFLKLVFNNNLKLVNYVREFTGYAITGEVSDQSLHIFVGDGSNGKGVLFGLLTAVLGEGEYVHTAPANLLLSDGHSDRHPTEKTGLRGARLVVCSETDEDRFIDEAKMKGLTGGDIVTARFMRGDFFSFEPTHKLALLTNYKPKVKGTDHGVWRRLRLVPFAVRFWKDTDKELDPEGDYPEQFKADPTLAERIATTEAEGVLADMVEQAGEFYRTGALQPPSEVTGATAEYRAEQDVIGQFFAARVRADDNGSVKASDFYKAFESWWEAEGHAAKKLPSKMKFGLAAKRKFNSSRPSGWVYHVRLLSGSSPEASDTSDTFPGKRSHAHTQYGVQPEKPPEYPKPPVEAGTSSEGSEGPRQNADSGSRAHAQYDSQPESASDPRNPRRGDGLWDPEDKAHADAA